MLSIVRFRPGEPARVHTALDDVDWKPGADGFAWIDLESPTDRELEFLSDPFHFHPMAIEDCLTPEHQPKIEDFGPYTFLIFRGIDFNPPIDEFQTLKLAAFLGPDYLVTYHRRPMRSVQSVLDKYANEASPPCRGADYLLYEILDHMVEHYFPVLEAIEDRIDALEEGLFSDPGPHVLDGILATKRRVLEIKRTLAPHREVFGRISRNEFEEISPQSVTFYRDLLSSSLEAYLSVVSQRTNDVMKVLTIFATVLLPLTFIVGVYGMNFDHMPELHSPYGYYVVWGVMLVIAAGMLWFFRRRGWL